jgi:SAM-dependent methyltransferase
VLNQVLEHVHDDRKALGELYRCLSPGGVAAITVPVIDSWRETYEDPAISRGPGDADRMLHFGWPDHLRLYGGADLRERIAQAGLELSEYVPDGAAVARYGLMAGETVFLARKPAG